MGLGSILSAAVPIVGGILGRHEQSSAAQNASNAQVQAANTATDEQRRQFDALQKLFAPYVNAGTSALTGYQDLTGLNGNPAQQTAISGLENSPEMSAYTQEGENALLQNASATGGLRGGNLQGALAKFRPQLLAQLINQQYGRYGNLMSLGQSSAAGTGNAGLQSANSIGNLALQSGAAQAGNYLAQGKANAGLYSGIAGLFGNMQGQNQDQNQGGF